MKVPYLNLKRQLEESFEAIAVKTTDTMFEADYILGKELELFEKEFADYIGVKHAIGVGNGTDSLIMCLKYLGVKEGDEVICPPNSWISTASAIALLGAKPVFVDVLHNQLMDPDLLELAITRRTKAIIPVHLTGKTADMKRILEIGEHHHVPVIEDAAQAVGSMQSGKMAGSFGLAGSFSMHPLKNLNAMGDAGVITTDSDEMNEWLRKARNHGLTDRDHVQFWGYNSRLDTIQAAVLRIRLLELDEVIRRRGTNGAIYTAELQGIVICPSEDPGHSFHTYTIQCDRRDELKAYLADYHVETKIHYPIPIHLQEAAKYLNYEAGDFPMVEAQAKSILSLPINQFLSETSIKYVCNTIRGFYEGKV